MSKKIVFDYSKLRGKIVEKYGTIKKFADTVAISRSILSIKMNNRRAFSQEEIYRIAILLDIEHEISDYFFTQGVKKS